MWRLKVAEGSENPWLRTTNNHVGREVWKFEPDFWSEEDRKAIEEARANFTKHRFEKKHSSDLIMRMQFAKENPCDLSMLPPVSIGENEIPSVEAVTVTLRRAVKFYSSIQAHDGHWPASALHTILWSVFLADRSSFGAFLSRFAKLCLTSCEAVLSLGFERVRTQLPMVVGGHTHVLGFVGFDQPLCSCMGLVSWRPSLLLCLCDHHKGLGLVVPVLIVSGWVTPSPLIAWFVVLQSVFFARLRGSVRLWCCHSVGSLPSSIVFSSTRFNCKTLVASSRHSFLPRVVCFSFCRWVTIPCGRGYPMWSLLVGRLPHLGVSPVPVVLPCFVTFFGLSLLSALDEANGSVRGILP
ncbi:Cycloartenol Synthase [Nymphaea thermarum]|nr:Cycloartenol Synthase [Nymphaea thermarum]